MSKVPVGVKRTVAILLLLAGVTPRHAAAGELLRDTFAGTSLSTNWEAPASSVRLGDGRVAFPGGQRAHVRSVNANWATGSFRAEITIAVSGDATGCGFFGSPVIRSNPARSHEVR